MKLRTTLAAPPAAALLALATCAEPPIPTAAGPADLGVDAPVLPSAGSGMRAIAEEWPLCRIATTETDQGGNPGPWVLEGRRGVAKGPPPRPDPFNGTSTVLEGRRDNQPQMIFWTADYCPTREEYGVELEIKIGLNLDVPMAFELVPRLAHDAPPLSVVALGGARVTGAVAGLVYDI